MLDERQLPPEQHVLQGDRAGDELARRQGGGCQLNTLLFVRPSVGPSIGPRVKLKRSNCLNSYNVVSKYCPENLPQFWPQISSLLNWHPAGGRAGGGAASSPSPSRVPATAATSASTGSRPRR